MKRNKMKGFTLVELLAVIVILAIILVIAVPKVMSVIEDSKKATLESTAKMIASAAEKVKVQNKVLGKTEEITCDSVAKINDLDYEDCKVDFEDNTAKVTIKGKGKFAGLHVCSGTKTDAEAQKEECSSPLEVKHPLFLAGQELTPDKFEVTLTESDGSKRVLENGKKLTFDETIEPTIVSSPNWPGNYPDDMTEEENFWEYTNEGAEVIQITFDATSETEEVNFDWIAIYDEDGNQVYKLGGIDFAGKTYTITGDYIKVAMISDSSENRKGFSATIKPASIVPAEYTISPSTAPNIEGNFDITITVPEQNISKKIIANVASLPKYGNATKYINDLMVYESVLNNGLVQTTAEYNGTTYDAGIRYVGAEDEVKNKVYYNCEDTDSNGVSYGAGNYDYASSCEVWRIIGVFDTKISPSGEAVPRVKLINTASTFQASWDSSSAEINSGKGINQWGESGDYDGADLMRLLNGYYIGEENATCEYCKNSNQESCEQTCNVQSLKEANMKILTSTAKGMIENAVWDTYAVRVSLYPNTSSNASTAYLQEKGISNQYTGISECSSCSDGVERTTSWTGLVGLMSVSDIGYANVWLYGSNNPWTISPRAYSSVSFLVWNAFEGDPYDFSAYLGYGVWPSVYLKPGIKVIDGNGDDKPYILAP